LFSSWKGPEARPLSEVSAQSRPQLNSGIMNRMTGLLSRMLNEPRQRSNRSDENSFDRVSEGISILFGNESGNVPGNDDAPSTSDAASGSHLDSEISPPQQPGRDSSSSGSEDEALIPNQQKYDYVKQKFLGHRNARTMIKEANFWGDDFVRKTCLAASSEIV
jgi:DDB1- and CUL4-associated factor 6